MVESYLICDIKSQNIDEEHHMDGSSKRIGDLPDEMLRHILSFLPTKDAVRTSVLSKKWLYRWTSILNLKFVEEPHKRALFMNFVERVLVLRDYSDVKEFSLTCRVLCDASRISAWISAAVMRKVQELSICLSDFEKPFVFPLCLFACESLRVLEVCLSCVLKLPPVICFSSLKILTLERVIFLDEYSTQQLFSGCPVLEELHLEECSWVNLKAVSICAPKLQKLIIIEVEMTDHSNSSACQIKIFGRSLKFFSFVGELINDYCVLSSSSLDKAYVDLYDWNVPRKVAYRVCLLLMGLYFVKNLTLSWEVVQVLNCAEKLFTWLPTFKYLTNLVFSGPQIHFACGAFLRLLQHLPRLRSLIFVEGISLLTYLGRDEWILDPVPSCFLSHLKSIEVRQFDGDEEELCVIKTLLKNALVLDRLLIRGSTDFAGDLRKQKKVHEQLLMLTRGSTSCSIVLY